MSDWNFKILKDWNGEIEDWRSFIPCYASLITMLMMLMSFTRRVWKLGLNLSFISIYVFICLTPWGKKLRMGKRWGRGRERFDGKDDRK